MCGRSWATWVVILCGLLMAAPAAQADEASSSCRPNLVSAPYSEPPARVSTTALGDLPAGYELDAPDTRPHGVVMIIHGGGWVDVGRAQVQALRSEAERWVARGWATANVDHRACAVSVDDVVRAYDAVRERVGPDTPIVISGESSGAHLGLVLAARRPDVAAVLARAAPADTATLGDGAAWDPDSETMTSWLPRLLADHGGKLFGADWTTAVSPVHLAPAIRARVLYARGLHDVIIPDDQGSALVAALRTAHPDGWARDMELDPGPVWFVHGGVSIEGERAYRAAELAAVEPWESSTGAPERVAGWWAPAGTGSSGKDTEPSAPADPVPADPTPVATPAPPIDPSRDPSPTTAPVADPALAPAALPTSPSTPTSASSATVATSSAPAASSTAGAATVVVRPVAPASWPALGGAPAASPGVTSAARLLVVTPGRAKRAARSAVLRRFRYRRVPSRFVITCRASGAAQACRVSWTAGGSSFRGTVRVASSSSAVVTTLRVLRSTRSGAGRRVVLVG